MSELNSPEPISKDFQRERKKLLGFLVAMAMISLAILVLVKLADGKSAEQGSIPASQKTVTLAANNIATLKLGHYALWGKAGTDTPVLIKRFNSINGQLLSLNGDKLAQWPLPEGNFSDYFVSIEPEGDRNTTPTDYVLLKCSLSKAADGHSQCILNFAGPAISSAYSGSYILATPTDNNNTVNEASGIWFTDPAASKASLNLSNLQSSKWAWEARLENGSKKVILGRFQQADGADNDSRYSLTSGSGFAFPGEDLLTNLPDGFSAPVNLTTGHYTITVSLEPDEQGSDLSGDLSLINVLEGTIPANALVHKTLTLKNVFRSPQIVLDF
jgi:hypothetical protein